MPNIPDGALNRVKYDPNDPNRPKLAKDIEAENGGAGVYNVDLKGNTNHIQLWFMYTHISFPLDKYLLADDEWKQDVIPEFWEGHNVADFIDPDIEEKLDALEREEERLEQEGFYDVNEPMVCRENWVSIHSLVAHCLYYSWIPMKKISRTQLMLFANARN